MEAWLWELVFSTGEDTAWHALESRRYGGVHNEKLDFVVDGRGEIVAFF